MTHDIKQKQPIHNTASASSSGDFSQAVRDEENISFQSPADKQPSDMERLETARESFSGRLLTDPQFSEIISITQILEREIFRSGSFKDKLADYCHAMSRSEKMDVKRLETIIRDLFKERVGQTMYQLCEDLKQREELLDDDAKVDIGAAFEDIESMMIEGDKITFNRALASVAQGLADQYGIKDITVIRIMAEGYNTAHPEGANDFWAFGRDLDEAYYRPQIEAEKEKRSASSNATARSFSKA